MHAVPGSSRGARDGPLGQKENPNGDHRCNGLFFLLPLFLKLFLRYPFLTYSLVLGADDRLKKNHPEREQIGRL